MLGFETELKHLDDKEVKVSKSDITQPGFIIKILGEGMPIHEKSGEFGDLYIKLNVNFPKELSESQRKSNLIVYLF